MLEAIGMSVVGLQQDCLHVPAGEDRFTGNNKRMIWGLIPLATKLSGRDTGGRVFVFEHRDMGRGGPPRHVHHDADEWFYVVRGTFAVEVGDERFTATAGDSMFAPRGVPHVWANVGDEPGTMLTIATPVGSFERFMDETTKLGAVPSEEELAEAFEGGGMTVVGPPLLAE
jgi:mannose-6-phosphate isomerase-like protein (cupin superfamily)